ncbi:MAG: hypothetical protein GY703_01480 [Gammaproteobacteria bacterium]|nr:hypothetical protein [Gammaproteobacteria bacterium]
MKPDGVALAAIQGLNENLEEQVRDRNSRIKALKNSLAELKSLVIMLAARQEGADL